MRPQASVDWSSVLACVLFLGMGMTTLILTFSPPQPETKTEAAIELLQASIEEKELPDELLVYGAPLEDLILSGPPLLDDSLKVRLISTRAPIEGLRDRYWVLSTTTDIQVPDGYEAETLREERGLKLIELARRDNPYTIKLSDQIHSAQAAFFPQGAGPSSPCSKWRFGRLFCGPNDWNWVGATPFVVNGKEERCIWAHPLLNNDLKITFPQIALTGPLKGKYALSDFSVQDPEGSPITFKVLVNGKEKIKRILPNRRGWNSFKIEQPSGDAKHRKVDLTFVVSAPNDGRRHFCFDGELLPKKK